MTLESGSRLGPYEVLAPIGAGGMGEVYRARDTRLDRVVALKTLPASLAANAMLRSRFEREARAISALNHPHICSLYDVGQEGGVDFLVMEHLEGETLDERIARGPLPVPAVLRIGIEIAAALDTAHRHGVIHRDLKPSNVVLTRTGAKLLDFGLARTLEGDHAPGLDLSAVTAHQPVTSEGVIVGTFPYMAPEQIEGQPVDARTDLFAFGAVLYEMLTGRRAFQGKSRASIIAAVLATDPPPIRDIQPIAPYALDRVIRICLAKDPEERWQSAHDVRLELEGIRDLPQAEEPQRAASRVRSSLPWVLLLLVLIGGAITLAVRALAPPPPPRYFQLMPPSGGRFVPEDGPAVIAPDGSTLVARVRLGSDRDRLWVRRLDEPEMRPLPGTEGAYDPFWSPDGTQIGFFADGKLKRISAGGGPVTTIAAMEDSRGATWMDPDTIVVASKATEPLVRISPAGGPPVPVTEIDTSRGEIGHQRPFALPDRRHFLYLAAGAKPESSGVWVGSVDGKVRKRVLDVAVATIYAPPGYLLYYHDGGLLAQRFDPVALETSGSPIRVASDTTYYPQWSSPGYSASADGVLVHHVRGLDAEPRIVSISREGQTGQVGLSGNNLDLSPDDRRIAAMRVGQDQGLDIWILDLERSINSRLTSGPELELGPVWSPDGDRIAYVVRDAEGGRIVTRRASGTGGEEEILRSKERLEAVDWSSDGRWLAVEIFTADASSNLAVVDLHARPPALTPIVETRFAEHSARFSPDARWLAYVSGETGQLEVHVQPFPPDGRRHQVSIGGGEAPRWSGNGEELLYVTRDRTVTSVELLAEGALRSTQPRPLVTLPSLDWVVTSDGNRFLAVQEETQFPQPLVIVTDWNPEAGRDR